MNGRPRGILEALIQKLRPADIVEENQQADVTKIKNLLEKEEKALEELRTELASEHLPRLREAEKRLEAAREQLDQNADEAKKVEMAQKVKLYEKYVTDLKDSTNAIQTLLDNIAEKLEKVKEMLQ